MCIIIALGIFFFSKRKSPTKYSTELDEYDLNNVEVSDSDDENISNNNNEEENAKNLE